mgnify:CR=1 FL=1
MHKCPENSMAFNRVIQFKRFLKYLCPFLRLYRCCLLAKVHNWGEQTLFRSGKELASITFEFASICLYPNTSFPLSKLEFGALQIPICSSANWTLDYSNRFFIGLTKFFQAYEKFFSLCWKNFFTIVIIFFQAFENLCKKFAEGY